MLVALKKSIAWRSLQGFGGRHERTVDAIGEHNLSIVGGNWEGILIGDRLSR